jgi:hypothetical protein
VIGLHKDPEVEESEFAAHRGQFEKGEVLVAGLCMDLVVHAAAAAGF